MNIEYKAIPQLNSNIYIPRSPFLSNVIHSIWQVDGYPDLRTETIIPKGVVEIIFDLAESDFVKADIGSKHYQLAKCFINGFNTCPVKLQLPHRHTFFGIRFHPVVIKSLVGAPACEFANHPIDLALADISFNSLWHQLMEKKSFSDRVAVISAWMEHRIIDIHPQEKLLNYFLCDTNQTALTITELATTICYSPRHLSRKMYELTGMNTEETLLYKKYLSSVHLIHTTELSLTEVAYQSRFFDQSHFIRSFKEFAQMTPGRYRQNKSHLSGHIFS